MQALELARKQRALTHIDKRELRSLEESLRAEQRITARGGSDRMPAISIDIGPGGRDAASSKTKGRYQSKFAQELAEAAAKGKQGRKIDLSKEFERAAGERQGDGKAQGSSDGPKPVSRSRSNRRRRGRRDRGLDKNRGR